MGTNGMAGRDKRLTRDLLEAIAKATEGGQSVKSSEVEPELSHWPLEQVWQDLRLLWEDDRIRAEDTKDLSDPDGMTSLLIKGLTAEGWALHDELAAELCRPPVRSWLARHGGTVLAIVGTAATVLAAIAAFR